MIVSEEVRCTRSLLNLCRMTKLSPQTQPLQICLGATTNKFTSAQGHNTDKKERE